MLDQIFQMKQFVTEKMDQKIQVHIPREAKIWTRATQISFQTKNSDDFYDAQNNALIFSFDKALLGQIIVN